MANHKITNLNINTNATSPGNSTPKAVNFSPNLTQQTNAPQTTASSTTASSTTAQQNNAQPTNASSTNAPQTTNALTSKKEIFVKIEEISVMVLGKPGAQAVQLTSDILSYNVKSASPVLTNKLPLITGTIAYNEKYLYTTSIRYPEKLLEFFFNKQEFEKRCNTMIEQGADSDKDNYTKNIENNVRIMLLLLFPTKFPTMRNISESYNEYILRKPNNDMSFKFTFNIEQSGSFSMGNKYTYIKLDGGNYTVTKVLWINDIYNHPVYRSFIDEYRDYIQRADDRHETLLNVIYGAITKLNIRFDKSQKNNLNLSDYAKMFKDTQNIIVNAPTPRYGQQSAFNIKKTQYEDDFMALFQLLEEFAYNSNSQIKKLDEIETELGIEKDKTKIEELNKDKIELINKMYTNAFNIKEIYGKILSNESSQLKKIPDFTNKIDNIVKELRKIVISIKIKDNYITTSDKINIKTEGEEEDVLAELNSKYKFFMDFVKRINDLIFPSRVSTKENDIQLQITNYINSVPGEQFSKLMQEIMSTIIKNKNTPLVYTSLYDVGVSLINPNDDKLPRYEIYVSLDLIEGQIDDKTKNKVNCFYNGTDLGTAVSNYFEGNNRYNAIGYKIYIKKEDYEKDAVARNIKDEPAPAPAPAPAPVPAPAPAPALQPAQKVGGRYRRRNTLKKGSKTKKTRKYRRKYYRN